MAQNKKKEQKKEKGTKDKMLGFPKEWTSFGGKQVLKNNQREKNKEKKDYRRRKRGFRQRKKRKRE